MEEPLLRKSLVRLDSIRIARFGEKKANLCLSSFANIRASTSDSRKHRYISIGHCCMARGLSMLGQFWKFSLSFSSCFFFFLLFVYRLHSIGVSIWSWVWL